MTAKDIHKALRALWPQDKGEWAYLEELRVATGYASGATQFIDAWVINCWPSNGNQRIAVEIKISRGDFKSELSKPLKRTAAYRISNEFYFAAPKGMIRFSELPQDSGLIEVDDSGVATIVHEAPWHDGESPSWLFVASLTRKIVRAIH